MKSNRSRFPTLLLGAGLLLVFALTARLAVEHKSATYDEPLHLVSAWIQVHDHDFRDDPDSASLWKYYAVAGTDAADLPIDHHREYWNDLLRDPRYEYQFSQLLYTEKSVDADGLINAARTRMVFLGVVLGGLICWWAWRLGGKIAGLVALTAFCFDPNFLAHSPLVKNDAPAALAFFALAAAAWLVGEHATFFRCMLLSAMLGIALTTKFSGLLALAIFAVMLGTRALIPQAWKIGNLQAKTFWHRLLAAGSIFSLALLVSFCIIWLSYLVRFSPSTDISEKFNIYKSISIVAENQVVADHGWPMDVPQTQLQDWVNQWQPDVTVRSVKWLNRHALLPQAYLIGFLDIYGQTMTRPAFLMGDIRSGGWWYYFPLAMLVKTPLATLAAFALALIGFLPITSAALRSKNSWNVLGVAIFPVLYLAAAMHAHVDLGLRYVLPVYPFLFVFLGVAAAHFYRRLPVVAPWVIGILVVGLATESFAAFPNYISFFNAAVGGSDRGRYLLGDSNIDWGQDLPALADWQKANPDRTIMLCYFGFADPRYYKIHYVKAPGSEAPEDESPAAAQSPVLAISVTALQGTYLKPEQRQLYEPFRNARPLANLGGSIYLFEVPSQWADNLSR